LCGGKQNEEMVECDCCKNWYHFKCVNTTKNALKSVKKYACPHCKDFNSQEPSKESVAKVEEKSTKKIVTKKESTKTNVDTKELTLNSQGKDEWCFCRGPSSKDHTIQCENCSEWFHYGCVNLTKPKAVQISKYFCDGCIKKDSSLKIVYYALFKNLKHDGSIFSTRMKDRSKRVAGGGHITMDNVQSLTRKRDDLNYLNNSKKIIRDSKNISEMRSYQTNKSLLTKKKKEEDAILQNIIKVEEVEEEEKPVPLSDAVLFEIERLGGKHIPKASRFYNGNILLIPPSIQYFVDFQFEKVLMSKSLDILHLEFNGEFKVKEWEEFSFLAGHENDYICFGWGEVMVVSLQFDKTQDFSDFNVYILEDKQDVEGPYKLSEFLKKFEVCQ
jgi:hypothetical protein